MFYITISACILDCIMCDITGDGKFLVFGVICFFAALANHITTQEHDNE